MQSFETNQSRLSDFEIVLFAAYETSSLQNYIDAILIDNCKYVNAIIFIIKLKIHGLHMYICTYVK